MLRKIWYYIFPFALVRWLAQKFGGSYWTWGDGEYERTYHAWRLADGEFYLIDCDKELHQRKEKLEKELSKINHALSKTSDYDEIE